MTGVATAIDATPRSRVEWMRNPALDTAIAFAWIPVFVWATVLRDDRSALQALATGVLLLAFCHQPVTLPLVYGDVRERTRLAAFLVLAPVVAVLAVYAAIQISMVLVALVSALWNAHHTLRQRYGLLRVYGRKVGQDDGRFEQAILLWWFGAALALAIAQGSLIDRLQDLPIGTVNGEIVDLLDRLRAVGTLALPFALGGAIVTSARWVQLERSRPQRNPAKYVYLAGALGLFVFVTVDPVAAFLGFMSAHAIEYLVVVERTLPKRAAPGSVLAAVSRRRFGPALFLGGYILVVLTVLDVVRTWLTFDLFFSVYLTVGVLHFVYDGMIWRLRRPAVAATFAITPAA